ncbi:hypothetical protein ABTM15_19415, partial [Acinetobacter baumannii]
TSVSIDLPAQTIEANGEVIAFDINPSNKEAIVNGWDLIGTTLVYEDKIASFESTDRTFAPTRA